MVLYASRSLQGETVPVALWEDEIPPGRVEVTCGQGQSALAQAFAAVRTEPALAGLEAGWEDERLVLTGADLFSAQRLETALIQAGLAQSGGLWLWCGSLSGGPWRWDDMSTDGGRTPLGAAISPTISGGTACAC